MKRPETLPQSVIDGITRYNSQHPKANIKADQLQWDCLDNCYHFTYENLYHGVELNGYIHT